MGRNSNAARKHKISAVDIRWHDSAKCKNEDVNLFFSGEGERQPERDVRERKAKKICDACPVWKKCLDHAMNFRERDGIWGGMNEDERASYRRKLQRRKTKVEL